MPSGKKYGGRKSGTPNKKTKAAISRAENVLLIIERKFFKEDIEKLSPAQRMQLYGDMLEYVSPKLSRQEITGSVKQIIKVKISDE